jgi:CPA1 family monovalent cation:H+ antiporter
VLLIRQERRRSRSGWCRSHDAGALELTQYHLAAILIAVIGPLLALARRFRVPESMLLFGVGAASTMIPGLPPAAVDPELVMTLFLPPLLYASTVRVTWHLLRFTFWPGVVLGSVLVATTIAVIAVATRSVFLPGLGWPAAILIGSVAAFFDTRLFHEAKGRLRVPRPIGDTLKARELIGRILILATLALVEDHLVSNGNVAELVVSNYLVGIPGGILAGVLVGQLAVRLRRRIDPAPMEIAVSVATPYAAALIAAAAGVSAAGAIIASALVVSAVRVDRETGATISSTEARINATAFWEQASLMISSGLFLLAGRAVPDALGALQTWPMWQVVGTAAGILTLALAVQLCFSYAAARIPPVSAALAERTEPKTAPLAAAAVMTWSSTRSVVALLLALSIPAALPGGGPFRERDLILAVATLVVIGSLAIQGLSLQRVVRWAGLADSADDEEEEAAARSAMQEAAASSPGGNASDVDAARQQLLQMRERDEIGDEVMTRMMREADLAERASEKDALPGAGPPQP